MSKMLTIICAASLLLCLAFLGVAVLIGGDDVLHDARSLRTVKPLIDLATRKEWRWNGGDSLALDTPINIRYQSGGPPNVSVTGPADLLRHVRVGNGRIESDTTVTHSSGAKLQAVVSGVALRKFVINGGENLDLGKIDQPDLDLHINGRGTVSGHGQTQRLNLVISGSGKANLGDLSVGDAKVSILGSGKTTLSPHGEVQLFIAGSGRLYLLTHPASLRQTIVGSGRVSEGPAGAAPDAAPTTPPAPLAPSVPPAPPAPPTPPTPFVSQEQMQRTLQLQLQVLVDPKTGNVLVRGNKLVDIGHVDQQTLNVTVADSGSATGEGKVDTLNVSVLGSGQANLGRIAARKVAVQIMGSGAATVAPSDELQVSIVGSGDVHVLTHPARIARSIMGSGHIVEEH
jgi:hypothetical protein